MFRKVVGLVMGALLLSTQCFAMTFSQPVKLSGKIGFDYLNDGFWVENPTQNNGDTVVGRQKKLNSNGQYFAKGVVQFGSGEDALYAHYDMYTDKGNVYFGSKNFQNTFPLSVTTNWQGEEIYKINTDQGTTLYMIFTGFDVPGDVTYYFLGRRVDGVWVKYLDTDIIKNNYFGKKSIVWAMPKITRDTITLNYKVVKSFWSGANQINEQGEFRFKWDDEVQWFGIEQVVY